MLPSSKSISDRIYRDLNQDIASGKYAVGTLILSENELAKRYKATRFFARKALNRLEEEGMITNRRGVGRIVNRRCSRIRRLGILDDHSLEFYRQHDPNMPGHVFDWQRGVFEACGQTGVTSIHLTGKSCTLKDRLYLLEQTLASNIDALIFRIGLLNRADTSEFLLKVRKCGVPALCMLAKLEAEDGLGYLAGNHYGVAQLLTSHLIDNGHENIAYIYGELGDGDDHYYRYRGVVDTLMEHGLPVLKEAMVPVEYSYCAGAWFPNGEYAVAKLHESRLLDNITAIVAFNDQMAEGAISKLAELGKRVPEDISIVGFDNDPRCRHLALTSGFFPFAESANRVTKRFIDNVDNREKDLIVEVMDPILVERGSVRKLNQ